MEGVEPSSEGFEGTVFEPGGLGSDNASFAISGLTRGGALSRYILIERVGAGGMGVVWSAYDPELDRKIAIKLLKRPGPARDGDHVRMIREARAMACLSHPNVTRIHDVGSFRGHVYLAMDLIEGKTLGRWVRSSRRNWAEIVEMFSQAGRGLAEAHRVGIVHRDFKPQNVLIGGEVARVTDFGLARGLGELQVGREVSGSEISELGSVPSLTAPLTRTGTMLGTPAYMAPEQFSAGQFDARSDQFSFCVALWEALYGQRPFGGRTLDELRAAVLAGQASPPPGNARVPANIAAALSRGMAVDPDQRWASMDALLLELERTPTPSWRKWAIAGGVVLSFAAAYFITPLFAARSEPGAHEQCAYAELGQEMLWSPEQAEAVEATLMLGELELRQHAAILAGLASHARRWQVSATALCDTQHQQRARAQANCLARRRIEFELRVELMAEPSPAVRAGLVSLVAGLRPVEDCLNPAYLANSQQASDSPEERSRWRALEAARAQVELGQPELAVAALARSEDEFAERQVELGLALLAADRGQEAGVQLETGLNAALREGDSDAAARAAFGLAKLSPPALGLAWIGRAEAWQDRMKVSSRDRTRLRLAQAQALARAGRQVEARAAWLGLLARWGVNEDLTGLGALGPIQALMAIEALRGLASLALEGGADLEGLALLQTTDAFARARVGRQHPVRQQLALELLWLHERVGDWEAIAGLGAQLRASPGELGLRARIVMLRVNAGRLELGESGEALRAGVLSEELGQLEALARERADPRLEAELGLARARIERIEGEYESAAEILLRVRQSFDSGELAQMGERVGTADVRVWGSLEQLRLEWVLAQAQLSLARGEAPRAATEFAVVVTLAQDRGARSRLELGMGLSGRALAAGTESPESAADYERAVELWQDFGGKGHPCSILVLEGLASLDRERSLALRAQAAGIRERLEGIDVAPRP